MWTRSGAIMAAVAAVALAALVAWTTHWARRSADGGTTFTTASGQRMTFAPGQVWVVLADR